MTVDEQRSRNRRLELVEQVETLNDDVKTLALNLAIHLAKVRSEGVSEELVKMEPQFVRLVNHAVKTVRDLAIILDAAKDRQTMVYDVPADRETEDRIEFGLRSILAQCSEIMKGLDTPQDDKA